MALNLKSSGGGSVTVDVPSTASNYTATLPAVNATLATNVNGDLYPLTSGTPVTASGSSVDFTNIPSWVKRITIMCRSISGTASSSVRIQLGYGATPTYVTTGYNTGSGYMDSTPAYGASGAISNGFIIGAASAASNVSGIITLCSLGNNTWVASGTYGVNDGSLVAYSYGGVDLGNTLTAVRLALTSGTYDNGTINILYE